MHDVWKIVDNILINDLLETKIPINIFYQTFADDLITISRFNVNDYQNFKVRTQNIIRFIFNWGEKPETYYSNWFRRFSHLKICLTHLRQHSSFQHHPQIPNKQIHFLYNTNANSSFISCTTWLKIIEKLILTLIIHIGKNRKKHT